MRIARFLAILIVALSLTRAFAADHAPGDHGGADLVLANGDVVWGKHSNVGRFVVPAGATATVKPMDRETSVSPRLYGWLEVHARDVEVAGTLEASGAGYTGGGGGVGLFQPIQEPGKGDYPSESSTGQTYYCWDIPWLYDACVGGGGGQGDGPAGGRAGTSYAPDRVGGYLVVGGNGDNSDDFSLAMGSGGTGGMGVGYSINQRSGPPHPSGGGGGRGGGMIKVFARDGIVVTGSVMANGRRGQNARPILNAQGIETHVAGGNSSPDEEGAPYPLDAESPADAFGGVGGGGGILFSAPFVRFLPGCGVVSVGGGGSTTNGGTVKVFAENSTIPGQNFNGVTAGRVLIKPGLPARTNHGGADYIVRDGEELSGLHYRVGRFIVPAGVTAKVKAMDRATSTSPLLHGWFAVDAFSIDISGTLDATGAGYTGGGGGVGSRNLGSPGRGDYPDSQGSHFEGASAHLDGRWSPGLGGAGDGPLGGTPGEVLDGGYRAAGTNGDSFADWDVDIGSGGAGGPGLGQGAEAAGPAEPSGGGGGRGGGMIRLVAGEITINGRILADGLAGQNAYATTPDGEGRPRYNGGNSSPAEQGVRFPAVGSDPAAREGAGGSGAGGGIYIQGTTIYMDPEAFISNTGGRGNTRNGGTLKILGQLLAPLPATRTGRLSVYPSLPIDNGWVDHAGADMIVANGATIGGRHVNVRRFVVPTGVTAKVRPMERKSASSQRAFGFLEVQAREIEIAGTLDATGVGYTGGGGGRERYDISRGTVGHGDYVDDEGKFFDGDGAYWSPTQYDVPGYGGPGDGPNAGDPERYYGWDYGDPVPAGGYRWPEMNGDGSTDRSVWIGSGGAGGTAASRGPAAGGGGRGGGALRLTALKRIVVSGRVLACGAWGQNAYATTTTEGVNLYHAGDSSPAENGLPIDWQDYPDRDEPSFGGGGAGGGILLDAPAVTVSPTATIANTGAGDRTFNGGTVKIFTNHFALPGNIAGAIHTGRLFIVRSAATDAWILE